MPSRRLPTTGSIRSTSPRSGRIRLRGRPSRAHGARPEPGQLLRRGGAGRLLPRQPGSGHGSQSRQDADGADLLVPRHPPAPHRANYEQLPINAPRVEVHSYNKDAPMAYRHSGAQPVYARTPTAARGRCQRAGAVAWSVEAGEMGRYAYEKHATTTTSARRARCTASDERHRPDNLVTNIVGTQRPRERRGPAAGDRLLEQRRPCARLAHRRRPRQDDDGDAFHEAAKLVESRSNRA